MTGFYQIALGQPPQLVVQTGHNRSDRIESLVFSPNGNLLASASLYTVKIWDAASGKELRSLNISGFNITAIGFNERGTGLLVANAGRITLWSVASGKPIWTISDVVNPMAFSADRKIFASANRTGVTIRDVETGEKLKDLEIAGIEEIPTIVFSPDGHTICVGADNGELKIINVADGKIMLNLPNQKRERNDPLVFSPDGKKLVSVTGEKISVWDVKTGKLLGTITNIVERSGRKSEIGDVEGVAFASDNQTIAVASGAFSKLTLWNAADGKLLKSLDYDTKDGFAGIADNSIIFSPDGKFLAGSAEGNIFFWDLNTRKIAKTFKGNTLTVDHVAFSPTNKTIVSISEFGFDNFGLFGKDGQGRTVSFWSNDGQDFRFLKGNAETATAAFTKDATSIFTVETIKEKEFSYFTGIKQWDVSSTKELQKFPVRLDGRDYLLSPDALIVAVIDTDTAKINLLDIKTGRVVGNIAGHQQRLSSFRFSPDGKFFATGSLDQTIKIWQMPTGKLLQTLKVEGDAKSLSFSSDNTLLAAHINESLKIWQTADGKAIQTIEKVNCREKGGFYNFTIAVSSDNRLLACGASNREKFSTEQKSNPEDLGITTFQIELFDIANGQKLRRFEGHQQQITACAFSTDNKFLVSGSDDSQTKLWDVSSGKELANMLVINEKDWLVSTPEGFFDGSPTAWKQLSWRFNNNTFDSGAVELYFNDFFYPNLLQDVLNGNSPKSKAGQELEKIDRRQPKVEIALSANTDKRTTAVTIEVADNIDKKKQPDHQETSGAQDLRLFRNGSLVKVWRGDVFDKTSGCEEIKSNKSRRVRCRAQVSIVAGENLFTAYAFNSSNVKSNDDAAQVKGADALKRIGTLYVLAVGVDKYRAASRNLKYAVADIDSISAELAAQQAKLTNKQYAKTEIIKLTDDNATKENILSALNRFAQNGDKVELPNNSAIQKELAKIQPTQPEDALIIYYAGHGTASKDRFYLIPHDGFPTDDAISEKSLEELYRNSISDEDLEKVLETVDVGKMLMVIDACNSGQALNSEESRRGPMNSRGLAQLAYEKGMYILTAAQSQQAALEVAKLGHGLLTFSLLEGINKAEKDAGGAIVERKWLDFAVGQVPLLQLEEMQKREVEIKKNPTRRDIGLAFKIGDDKNLPPDKRGLQTPRIFYRRELEFNPLIVAKP